MGQGILRQETYRFEVSSIAKEATSLEYVRDFVEDTLGQVWAINNAYLLKIGRNKTEIFATSGNSEIDGFIQRVFTDFQKHLWVGTNKGLYHLDPLNQRFTHHQIKLNDQIVPSNTVAGLGPYLYVGTKKGEIIRYHPKTKRATLLKTGFEQSFISMLNRTSTGEVFVTNNTHLYQIVDSNRIIRICKLPEGTMPLQAESIDKNYVYLTTLDGSILKVNLITKQLNKIRNSNNEITRGPTLKKISWNGNNYLAQATVNGLNWLNPKNDEQIFWKNNPYQKGSNIIGPIYDVFQDKSNRIWISNGENCLTVMPIANNTTPYFLHEANTAFWSPLDEEGPSCIISDKNNDQIIYSINDTLIFFNKKNSQITSKYALGKNKTINYLEIYNDGELFAATSDGLFNIIKGKSILFSDSLTGKNVISLLIKGDTIFAGTFSNGLYTLLRNGRFIKHYSKESGLPSNHIPNLCLDKENKLWVVIGRNNLYVRDGIHSELVMKKNVTLLTYINHITCHSDSNKLWLAGSGGILSYEIKKDTIAKVINSSTNGMDNNISSIHQKDDGKIFIITTRDQLFEWDVKRNKILPINLEKGWWAENFLNRSRIAVDENGKWWGTFRYGLIKFNTSTFFSLAELNSPDIHEIEINYSPINYHPAAFRTNPLELKHSESPLTMVCSSIYNNKVEFKLEGLENTWHIGERATYTNLREGNYTFKVRTVDEVGNSSPERIMMVKVLPPWWRTWWFRILASLLISTGLYFFIRKSIENIQKENEYKIKLANSELTAIRSQMNPHFIFNCMTAIDGLIATQQNLKASEYLGKFSKLVRQVLQLSEKQLISLGDELDTLKLYLQLEQLRTQDFTYEFKVEENLLEEIEIPPLLLQPIVENAILHGLKTATHDHKKIIISANKIENKIQFEIEDNGIGRQQSTINNLQRNNHKSMGGKLTKDRLQIMEQLLNIETNLTYKDLHDDLENATGTKVILTLTSKS